MSNDKPLRLGCLVMAAGSASRFGENKLGICFDGRTLFARALDAIPSKLFSAVTVVTQYPAAAELAAARGFSVIENRQPELGISHTIHLGTRAMEDCDGILYLVSDQPLLSADSVRKIVAAWKKAPEMIVGACHDGHHGNPNLFPSRFFPALLALSGDRGGSRVICTNPDAFLPVEVGALELTDCDTPQQLAALKSAIE